MVEAGDSVYALTPRQLLVIRELSAGADAWAVGKALGVSRARVKIIEERAIRCLLRGLIDGQMPEDYRALLPAVRALISD